MTKNNGKINLIDIKAINVWGLDGCAAGSLEGWFGVDWRMFMGGEFDRMVGGECQKMIELEKAFGKVRKVISWWKNANHCFRENRNL